MRRYLKDFLNKQDSQGSSNIKKETGVDETYISQQVI